MITTTLLLLCAGGVSIVLPPAATSSGMEISVDEIAQVEGEDADEVERVRAASLGYAPAPGYHRYLRADLLKASLRQSLPDIEITVKGAPRCLVTSATTTVPGMRLTAEASQALRAALTGMDAEARPLMDLPDLVLPASDAEPQLRTSFRVDRVFPGKIQVPVEVWIGERIYRTVQVRFEVTVWKRQAVLKQAIPAGTELSPGMFKVVRTKVKSGSGLQALELHEIPGSVANRAMAAGASLGERDVKRMTLVRRGDLVQVAVKNRGVTVKDVGQAQSNGRMGERVRVQLRSSGVELLAVVRGPKLLEVKIK